MYKQGQRKLAQTDSIGSQVCSKDRLKHKGNLKSLQHFLTSQTLEQKLFAFVGSHLAVKLSEV